MTAPWIAELLDGATDTYVRDRDDPAADGARAMRWAPAPTDPPAAEGTTS